jgi:NifU-like protein
MDHFKNPRNVGKIENPDGVGEVGSLACGDALKLMFKLDGSGHIAEAKFQTFDRNHQGHDHRRGRQGE